MMISNYNDPQYSPNQRVMARAFVFLVTQTHTNTMLMNVQKPPTFCACLLIKVKMLNTNSMLVWVSVLARELYHQNMRDPQANELLLVWG